MHDNTQLTDNQSNIFPTLIASVVFSTRYMEKHNNRILKIKFQIVMDNCTNFLLVWIHHGFYFTKSSFSIKNFTIQSFLNKPLILCPEGISLSGSGAWGDL